MRIAVPFLALAAFAAAALLAQKPGAVDPEAEAYRGQGISLCVANLQAADGVTAEDGEAICGCAFDRFMPRWPAGALPARGSPQYQAMMGSDLLSCAAEQRPAVAAAVARRLVATPAPTADEGGKPIDTAADTPERPGRDLRAWWNGLTLPRWASNGDLPLWAWVVLALFVFLFLRGLLRRREERDLDGPPPSMRPGGRRPGPPPPRL